MNGKYGIEIPTLQNRVNQHISQSKPTSCTSQPHSDISLMSPPGQLSRNARVQPGVFPWNCQILEIHIKKQFYRPEPRTSAKELRSISNPSGIVGSSEQFSVKEKNVKLWWKGRTWNVPWNVGNPLNMHFQPQVSCMAGGKSCHFSCISVFHRKLDIILPWVIWR